MEDSGKNYNIDDSQLNIYNISRNQGAQQSGVLPNI